MPRRAINSPDYRVPIDGFSQVVEAPVDGRLLFVSGLTSRDARGEIVAVGDVTGQTRQVLRRMAGVLEAAGATLDDVVQIRTYVRDMGDWPAIEAVWREVWSEPWPASTCVEISRLHDTRQLIEMDAVAVAARDPR
jgi:enamine deaminase RidA (YjgF/YER057c/UK114 family)